MDIKNFFDNGFCSLFDYELAQEINLKTINWKYEGGEKNDFVPEKNSFLDAELLNVHMKIAEKYVDKYFSEYHVKKRRIWKGVNEDATFWHNDLREGPNCFFLLYFSNMEKINEGAVYFKSGKKEFKIYPKPGTLIAVNCSENFFHKADFTDKERIQASFCFDINYGTYN
jgi:hypothetical protein